VVALAALVLVVVHLLVLVLGIARGCWRCQRDHSATSSSIATTVANTTTTTTTATATTAAATTAIGWQGGRRRHDSGE